jgi:hypothetical protein
MKPIRVEQAIITDAIANEVSTLQTGGAELWISTLRNAIDCVANADGCDSPENRLNLVRELLALQDTLKCFIPEQKGGQA